MSGAELCIKDGDIASQSAAIAAAAAPHDDSQSASINSSQSAMNEKNDLAGSGGSIHLSMNIGHAENGKASSLEPPGEITSDRANQHSRSNTPEKETVTHTVHSSISKPLTSTTSRPAAAANAPLPGPPADSHDRWRAAASQSTSGQTSPPSALVEDSSYGRLTSREQQQRPYEWTKAYLLERADKIVANVRNVYLKGGQMLEKEMLGPVKAALKANRLTVVASAPDSASFSRAPVPGFSPTELAPIFAAWSGFCRRQKLPTFPIIGGLVCIFLEENVAMDQRQNFCDALELYRAATSPTYLKARWETAKITTLFEDTGALQQYKILVEHSIWPLSVWQSITELLEGTEEDTQEAATDKEVLELEEGEIQEQQEQSTQVQPISTSSARSSTSTRTTQPSPVLLSISLRPHEQSPHSPLQRIDGRGPIDADAPAASSSFSTQAPIDEVSIPAERTSPKSTAISSTSVMTRPASAASIPSSSPSLAQQLSSIHSLPDFTTPNSPGLPRTSTSVSPQLVATALPLPRDPEDSHRRRQSAPSSFTRPARFPLVIQPTSAQPPPPNALRRKYSSTPPTSESTASPDMRIQRIPPRSDPLELTTVRQFDKRLESPAVQPNMSSRPAVTMSSVSERSRPAASPDNNFPLATVPFKRSGEAPDEMRPAKREGAAELQSHAKSKDIGQLNDCNPKAQSSGGSSAQRQGGISQDRPTMPAPYADFTPSMVSVGAAFSGHTSLVITDFAQLMPLPVVTASPFPTPASKQAFVLSPRHVLNPALALAPMSRVDVQRCWNHVQSLVSTRSSSVRDTPVLQEQVHAAIRDVRLWIPKARSPAAQEAAAAGRNYVEQIRLRAGSFPAASAQRGTRYVSYDGGSVLGRRDLDPTQPTAAVASRPGFVVPSSANAMPPKEVHRSTSVPSQKLQAAPAFSQSASVPQEAHQASKVSTTRPSHASNTQAGPSIPTLSTSTSQPAAMPHSMRQTLPSAASSGQASTNRASSMARNRSGSGSGRDTPKMTALGLALSSLVESTSAVPVSADEASSSRMAPKERVRTPGIPPIPLPSLEKRPPRPPLERAATTTQVHPLALLYATGTPKERQSARERVFDLMNRFSPRGTSVPLASPQLASVPLSSSNSQPGTVSTMQTEQSTTASGKPAASRAPGSAPPRLTASVPKPVSTPVPPAPAPTPAPAPAPAPAPVLATIEERKRKLHIPAAWRKANEAIRPFG